MNEEIEILKNIKPKEEQAENWIPSGTEPGGGHWVKAGYENDEAK